MSTTKFVTFDELLEMTPEGLRSIAEYVKKTIHEIDPDTCEVVRLGDRAATFGVGPKKMSEGYVYLMPHKSWINLGFYKGAVLPDPEGLLEGTGKKLRHIKLRSLDDAKRVAVKELIEAAFAERKQAKNV